MADSTLRANFAPQSGRVAIIGEQPLLEMVLGSNGGPVLVPYGRSGYVHQVETAPGAGNPTQWSFWQQTVLANLWQEHPAPAADQQRCCPAKR